MEHYLHSWSHANELYPPATHTQINLLADKPSNKVKQKASPNVPAERH